MSIDPTPPPPESQATPVTAEERPIKPVMDYGPIPPSEQETAAYNLENGFSVTTKETAAIVQMLRLYGWRTTESLQMFLFRLTERARRAPKPDHMSQEDWDAEQELAFEHALAAHVAASNAAALARIAEMSDELSDYSQLLALQESDLIAARALAGEREKEIERLKLITSDPDFCWPSPNERTWLHRAESAEAQLVTANAALELERTLRKSEKQAKVERGDMLCDAEEKISQLEKYKARLEWLHTGSGLDPEGFEWGVYRAKWNAAGQLVSLWHTLSDFSDLDAEMAREVSARAPSPVAQAERTMEGEGEA